MAIQLPTPSQLREVANQVGLDLTEADLTSFIELMRPNVAAYNVVDAMPDNLPSVRYPAYPRLSPGRRGKRSQRLVCEVHRTWCAGRETDGQNGGPQGQHHAGGRAHDERVGDAGRLHARYRRDGGRAHSRRRRHHRRQSALRGLVPVGW